MIKENNILTLWHDLWPLTPRLLYKLCVALTTFIPLWASLHGTGRWTNGRMACKAYTYKIKFDIFIFFHKIVMVHCNITFSKLRIKLYKNNRRWRRLAAWQTVSNIVIIIIIRVSWTSSLPWQQANTAAAAATQSIACYVEVGSRHCWGCYEQLELETSETD